MQKLDAADLATALAWLDKLAQTARLLRDLGVPPLAANAYIERIKYAEDALKICEHADLPAAAISARRVLDRLGQAKNFDAIPDKLHYAVNVYEDIEHFSMRVIDELSMRYIVTIATKNVHYLDASKPHFGNEVFDAFSSANDDIAESAQCLALDRGTACVMHLMRAAEVALKALGKALGVGAQSNWGSYLREIEKELARRAKQSGARTADEQFYSEAAISFDHLKRAWRNPTMHVERTYSPERASEIFEAVRSLMRHLASRIRE